MSPSSSPKRRADTAAMLAHLLEEARRLGIHVELVLRRPRSSYDCDRELPQHGGSPPPCGEL